MRERERKRERERERESVCVWCVCGIIDFNHIFDFIFYGEKIYDGYLGRVINRYIERPG